MWGEVALQRPLPSPDSLPTGFRPALHFWRVCHGAGARVQASLLLVLTEGLRPCSAESKPSPVGAAVAQLGTMFTVSPPHGSQPLRLTISTPLTDEDLERLRAGDRTHSLSVHLGEGTPAWRPLLGGTTQSPLPLYASVSLQDPVLSQTLCCSVPPEPSDHEGQGHSQSQHNECRSGSFRMGPGRLSGGGNGDQPRAEQAGRCAGIG